MLFLRTGVICIVSGAKVRKIFRKSIRHFVEKPLIRYLARGAIRGFLENRGVREGGKVKVFGQIPKDDAKSASASEGAVDGITESTESKTGVF